MAYSVKYCVDIRKYSGISSLTVVTVLAVVLVLIATVFVSWELTRSGTSNDCESSLCRNGGRTGDGFTCQCASGFKCHRCETDAMTTPPRTKILEALRALDFQGYPIPATVKPEETMNQELDWSSSSDTGQTDTSVSAPKPHNTTSDVLINTVTLLDDHDQLTSSVVQDLTSSGGEELTTSGDEDLTTSGDEEIQSSGDEELTSSVDEDLTSSGDEDDSVTRTASIVAESSLLSGGLGREATNSMTGTHH